MIDLTGKKIIISRTDSIGDVILTLPICAWLKHQFEGIKITFLGQTYTRPIIEAFEAVDEFLDWNNILTLTSKAQQAEFNKIGSHAIIHVFPNKQIAKLTRRVGIKHRVGTLHRIFHLRNCNHRVNFTRKDSKLHESQLNFELLRCFGITEIPKLPEILSLLKGFNLKQVALPMALEQINGYTILHPKSQGSAMEWPIGKYLDLALKLVAAGKTVAFTGTENEGQLFRNLIPKSERVVDTTGKLSLEQLMTFIAKADNLVAGSTGPLHIAGFSGIRTVGLYSSRRPIHPERWQALGQNVTTIVYDPNCNRCAAGKHCDCIRDIAVDTVFAALDIKS